VYSVKICTLTSFPRHGGFLHGWSADILSAGGRGTFCPALQRERMTPDRMSAGQQRAKCTRSIGASTRTGMAAKSTVQKSAVFPRRRAFLTCKSERTDPIHDVNPRGLTPFTFPQRPEPLVGKVNAISWLLPFAF
jgi:hypothetical protein